MSRTFAVRGFTLIELLIVVAIIAVLAAIAVPNFLEAQVRSKVSRTKADHRTIATALKAYRLDYNHDPEQGCPPAQLGLTRRSQPKFTAATARGMRQTTRRLP